MKQRATTRKKIVNCLLALLTLGILGRVQGIYPHWSSVNSFCTAGNWFLGYNADAGYSYQVIDVHPMDDYFVVGGKVSDAGGTVSRGAVILLYPKFGAEPE